MRTFLLMLVLCVSGMAQELVGTSNGRAYYIYPAVKHDRAVKFVGVISPYYDDKFIIDKNNYLMTVFIANCDNYRYVAKRYLKVIDGKSSEGVYKEEIKQAVKPQVIFNAIQAACANKNEDYY